uniref:Uncharacterized protein n=1 Tax=Arundo donax TaxID=35708 RepID=A0A0A9G7Z8_ARUDO
MPSSSPSSDLALDSDCEAKSSGSFLDAGKSLFLLLRKKSKPAALGLCSLVHDLCSGSGDGEGDLCTSEPHSEPVKDPVDCSLVGIFLRSSPVTLSYRSARARYIL